MSLADQQATYYRDPDTGHLMMPGTRRPDGTWRKPRRIKEGYIPQDEVPLYESKGKQVAKAREGYVPGLSTPGLSQAIMNMTIDTFDSRSPTGSSSGTKPIPGLPPDLVKQAASMSQNSAKSVKKKKSKSATSAALLARLAPTDEHCAAVNESPSSKTAVLSMGAKAIATDPVKRLRNLRKKLRVIECLEEKLESGEIVKPEPEQLEKVGRKGQVENEIEELERQLEG